MNLEDMKKEDILNSELIGNGIPDLQDELDKLKADGSQESQDEDIFGFGGNDQGEDIFGFNKKDSEED